MIRDREFDVTVQEASAVASVEAYNVVIVGSPIHAGMWLSEISQFFERFQAELQGKPLYFFMTCIRVLEPDGPEHVVDEYVNHVVLKHFDVREIKPFAGKLAMDAVDWEDRWTLAARYDGQQPPGSYNNDFRDWAAIRAWAAHIADLNLLG